MQVQLLLRARLLNEAVEGLGKLVGNLVDFGHNRIVYQVDVDFLADDWCFFGLLGLVCLTANRLHLMTVQILRALDLSDLSSHRVEPDEFELVLLLEAVQEVF